MSEVQIIIKTDFPDKAAAEKIHHELKLSANNNENELYATLCSMVEGCNLDEWGDIWISKIALAGSSISIYAYSGIAELGPIAETLFELGAVKTVVEQIFDEDVETHYYLGKVDVTENQYKSFRKRGANARKAVEEFSKRTPLNSWLVGLEKSKKAAKRSPKDKPEISFMYDILSSEIFRPYHEIYFLNPVSPPDLYAVVVPRQSDDMYGGSSDGYANQIIISPYLTLGGLSEGYARKGCRIEVCFETTDKGTVDVYFNMDEFDQIIEHIKGRLKELESYIGAK